MWSGVFIASLIILIKSADYFINYASKLGLILRIPPFVIGLTIVALGTSIPELITSLVAIIDGSPEFIAGNVVGSNIANILLIVGVCVIAAKKIRSKLDLIRIDVPLLTLTTAVLIFVLWDGKVQFHESLMLCMGYITYIWYFTSIHRTEPFSEKRPEHTLGLYLGILACIVGIYIGAEFTIRSVQNLTLIFELPDTSIIAATAVALGTSLPELVISYKAIMQKNVALAFGNIMGSNVINASLIMGLPGLFTTLPVTSNVITIGLPFLATAVLLYSITLIDKQVTKFEGVFFLLLYALYLASFIGI